MSIFPSSFIGFDDLLSHAAALPRSDNSFPPYDVRQLDESMYELRMAVAGYKEQDLEVLLRDVHLTITGKVDVERSNFLHKGISTRKFHRNFRLAEGVEVSSVVLEDGILTITLNRSVPEALQTKRLEIGYRSSQRGDPQLLEE